MEKFNDNWDKIDTALTEKMGKAEEILVYEYTGNNDWSVDVTMPEDMDWSKYNIVGMEASPVVSGDSTCTVSFAQPGVGDLSVSLKRSYGGYPPALLLLFPGRRNDGGTFGVSFSGGAVSHMGDSLGPGALVQVSGDQGNGAKISRGTTFRLWGI